MPQEYTRQRQGRDFSLQNYLTNAASAKHIEAEIRKTADEANSTLARRLEHYKEESERNAAPIDGHEPSEKGRTFI